MVGVAQLVVASGCGPEGRGIVPRLSPHNLICLRSSYVWSERRSEKPEVCWFDSDRRHQHILDKILGTSETSNILNKKVESVDAQQYERMSNGLLSKI